MEWLLITVFFVFMTGIGIVTVQAVRNGSEKDDKSSKSKRS